MNHESWVGKHSMCKPDGIIHKVICIRRNNFYYPNTTYITDGELIQEFLYAFHYSSSSINQYLT